MTTTRKPAGGANKPPAKKAPAKKPWYHIDTKFSLAKVGKGALALGLFGALFFGTIYLANKVGLLKKYRLWGGIGATLVGVFLAMGNNRSWIKNGLAPALFSTGVVSAASAVVQMTKKDGTPLLSDKFSTEIKNATVLSGLNGAGMGTADYQVSETLELERMLEEASANAPVQEVIPEYLQGHRIFR